MFKAAQHTYSQLVKNGSAGPGPLHKQRERTKAHDNVLVPECKPDGAVRAYRPQNQ